MFERYTEKARRVIFFARYEASQCGSPYIESEHLLLGLLREDKTLTNRFLRTHASLEAIRKEIEGRTVVREKGSTSVDLPLSHECKRVLNYAAEEAERLSHKHIGTEHLLLGLLREERCFAAEMLQNRGLRLAQVREDLARSSQERSTSRPKESSLLVEFSRDLTQAAVDGQLDPLIGREHEVERIIQILCRRRKNNPILLGEAGVGKTAIVEGLAQKIDEGDVPPFLAEQAHLRPRPLPRRGRHQVPRPVRRAPQVHHHGAHRRTQTSSSSSTRSTPSSAPAPPRAAWTPPTSSSRPSPAARSSASAPPPTRSTPSTSTRTAPWCAASSRSR